jgi:hypothetical protein
MSRLVAMLLLLPSVCLAQNGGVVIRIPDGANTRCINPAKDRVWITLRRLVTTRTQSWLKKDNTVAVIIKATVNSEPAETKMEFPLMSEASFNDAAFGQVSLPIEYNIVNGLKLTATNNQYFKGIGIDITLLNRRGKNAWGSALSALSEVSAKLPIPSNPITQAGSYLMSFANSAVDKDLANQANDDKVKTATLAMNFDPTAACAGEFESSGTIAIVRDIGSPDNLIKIGDVNNYCWSAELRPAFVVKAAAKDQAFPCTSDHYSQSYKQISNNYVGFFVNAVQGTGTSGATTELVNRDREAALARCKANGYQTRKDCGL